ncbi:S1 family peptidase [Amycolatopsis jiangsuensis]|uniref:Secreted trypsin-like serine protease n=1 Tax=Amycolatopsis jiangsuensis TaxID=1181879 RepID=A0A840IRU2_9PSEU|nr:trypsin-like serine protease [Amycolatopsis jiangsuensis]MBB4684155.1 secreted trypsin-like serine protease [Amycolatopsis jiangsuensis]
MRLPVRSLGLLTGACAALGAFTVTPATAAPADPYIIGGSTAQNPGYITRFNGHANGYTFFCTSSLIGSRWVLTAKHCMYDNNGAELSDIDLYIGSNQSDGGVHAKAESTYLYSGGDLALIELDTDGGSTFAQLASSGSDANEGDNATVYGWGATQSTDEGQHQSPVLKKAEVTISDTNASDNAGGPGISASTPDGAVAGGDSGGPMVDGDVQVGVCSTSDRSSITTYGSVAAGRDWIRQVAGV